MRYSFLLSLALTLNASLAAQTPGVAGVNDYWITPGGTPGGVSCKFVNIVTPTTMTLNVSAAPNTPFVIVWSTCPCIPCSPVPAFGTSGCLPGPSSACGSSNQFLEVGLMSSCLTFTMTGVTSTAGTAAIPILVPPASPPFRMSSQVALLGAPSCVVAPFSLLLSQGWNVSFM
jgi:hypothetical protein